MDEELLNVTRSIAGMTAHLLAPTLAREHYEKSYQSLTYGEIAVVDAMIDQAASGGRVSIFKAILNPNPKQTPET